MTASPRHIGLGVISDDICVQTLIEIKSGNPNQNGLTFWYKLMQAVLVSGS